MVWSFYHKMGLLAGKPQKVVCISQETPRVVVTVMNDSQGKE